MKVSMHDRLTRIRTGKAQIIPKRHTCNLTGTCSFCTDNNNNQGWTFIYKCIN